MISLMKSMYSENETSWQCIVKVQSFVSVPGRVCVSPVLPVEQLKMLTPPRPTQHFAFS